MDEIARQQDAAWDERERAWRHSTPLKVMLEGTFTGRVRRVRIRQLSPRQRKRRKERALAVKDLKREMAGGA